jgi:hypothetical protein
MIDALAGSAFTLIAVYVIADLVVGYYRADGSIWSKLVAAGRDSATILWQRLVLATAALSGVLVTLADTLGAPQVDNAIRAVLQPQWVPIYGVMIAVIGELARRRTL